MRRFVLGMVAAMAAGALAPPVSAQNLAPSAFYAGDHYMRSSKMIGMDVYNTAGEKIGVLEDVMVPMGGGKPMAVLSVGGFLGIGQKLIKVPLDHIHLKDGKAVMPNATKPAMMAMPPYFYGARTN